MSKPITYGVAPRIRVTGKYRGYNYYIVESYMNPCAYVVVPKSIGKKKHPLYEKSPQEVSFFPVHGGLTYISKEFSYTNIGRDNFVIGWDYAHGGDFIFLDRSIVGEEVDFTPYDQGYKYTIEDIKVDIRNCVDYLIREYDNK